MPFWQERFGHLGTTGPMISVIFSIYNVGSFIGGFPAAFVIDRWGRRVGMAFGAVIVIVGSVIVVTAYSVAQFVV